MVKCKKNVIKTLGLSLLATSFITLTGCGFLSDTLTTIVFSEKIEIYDYEEINVGKTTVSISKGKTDGNPYITLEDRGIIFNKEDNGQITEISVNVNENSGSSAYLYLSKTPLGIDKMIPLEYGENVITPTDDYGYFVIQNEGQTNSLTDLNVTCNSDVIHEWEYEDFPTLDIRTNNSQGVYSKTSYVECTIFANEVDEEEPQMLKGQIRVRGNSTSKRPKLPYRIKLDKKASLFGYASAKNWVLLADFMDGSRMHNFSALTFSRYVRKGGLFSPTPIHVKLRLNGVDQGLYLFCEHIDEKDGRLNLSQKAVWNKSLNDINFYMEIDNTCLDDDTLKEGEDFFQINNHIYAIKYPKKEDFEEELSDGSINYHEKEFETFFTLLKEYFAKIEDMFIRFKDKDISFDELNKIVDCTSLAQYSLIDQFFSEKEHDVRSFKMYKKADERLKFGPNWDYDADVMNIPYFGYYVLNPYKASQYQPQRNLSIASTWGKILYSDKDNGFPLFKEQWNRLTTEDINSFLDIVKYEARRISKEMIEECKMWMDSNYCAAFDNMKYALEYISSEILYLSGHYSE